MKAERPHASPSHASEPWNPSTVRRLYRVIEGTSTSPLHVLTDAGPAYVKALGNPEGPHALVCDLVGTRLAAWLGLPTFEVAVLNFPEGIPARFRTGEPALPGPAFATREARGRSWSGEVADLAYLENMEAVAGLIVLDTWLRNSDRAFGAGAERRRNYENVFLCEGGAAPGRYRLLAIDHTACFRRTFELTARVSRIDNVRDPALYGLFEDFSPVVQRKHVQRFASRLRSFEREDGAAIVAQVPERWDLTGPTREALVSFLHERACFVGSGIETWLATVLGWRDP